MPLTALALVVAAACLHATWNLWVKKAQAPGVAFVWWVSIAALLVYLPLVLGWFVDELVAMNARQWVAALVSGGLHIAYFVFLQRGYAAADLSIVYPVARGVGPLLASVMAMIWLSEPPTPAAIAGLALIVCGTFTLAGGVELMRGGWSDKLRAGLAWGSATGVCIAAYTVNDGHAVKMLALSPLLFDWLSHAVRAVALTPLAIARRAEVAATGRRAWKWILGVAIMSPLAYIMVLEAMRIAPVSHVAPARELSMLIAAFLGAHLLREGQLRRRLVGAALIACGVACLALAR